jgi:flagellar biogenesis protein FliO
LARAWSWLHSKYTLSATKRLRVSETVSLGEKRFVALVCVEGREFLIGGGAAGVSLLSALGSAPGGANSRQSESSDAEVSE